jgi:hypothetical protein
MVDNELTTRGYCKHCGEDAGAPLPEKTAEAAPGTKKTSPDQLRCPECARYSNSIKCYRMGVLLFLLLFWFAWTRNETACPSCMRLKIASFCLVNLFTANVIWPLIILPWTVILFLRTLTKGHSEDVG